MIKKSNHRISLILPKVVYDNFQHNFPNCLSRFLRNCVNYALQSKEFFQSAYFNDLDNSLVDYVVQKMNNRLDGVLDK